MVRNIEAALGGMTPQLTQSKKDQKRSGGKVARMAEGIR
jgi:hypothetical protein